MKTNYYSNIEESQAKNRERKNKAYAENPGEFRAKAQAWRDENPEKHREYNKKYKEENRGYYNAKQAERKAMQLQRTPKWLTLEDLKAMEEIYKTCPEGYHVDHILPLNGDTVSGLHCPANLQHLSAADNIRKRNKHE